MKTQRLFFDIETEAFSFEFSRAGKREKRTYAPNPIVAIVYDEQKRRYATYFRRDFKKLCEHLEAADEVVSFNGKNFDVPVIERIEHRLKLRLHTDLCEEAFRLAGYGLSLDVLARENLGQGKLFKGIDLPKLPIGQIIRGCKSDVAQTYRLYNLWKRGTLRTPVNPRNVLRDIFSERLERSGFSSNAGQRARFSIPTTKFFSCGFTKLKRAASETSFKPMFVGGGCLCCSVSDLRARALELAIIHIQSVSWVKNEKVRAALNPFFCSRSVRQSLPQHLVCRGSELIDLVRYGALLDFQVTTVYLYDHRALKRRSRELLVKHAAIAETLFRSLERYNAGQAFLFASQFRGCLLTPTLQKLGRANCTKTKAEALIREKNSIQYTADR